MGSLHTVRDKEQLGLVGNESLISLSREALGDYGLVVARLTARAVDPGPNGKMGIRIFMDADRSPYCNISTEVLCDGGGFNGYEVEGLLFSSSYFFEILTVFLVVDRMGADSFTPDSGVMISKSKINSDGGLFQWTIDANPQDINLLDFYRPDGTPAYITMGDYRQLADALFHSGTRSGSEYEYVDKANSLHFYVINAHRDTTGVLSYTAAVRALSKGPHNYKAALGWGKVVSGRNSPIKKGVTCSYQLTNKGSYVAPAEEGAEPQDVWAFFKSDVYRLKATVEGRGWKVELPNALATAEFGKTVTVQVAVAADSSAALAAIVKLTATSESDPSVSVTGSCIVGKYFNF